jgi:hypothetical protein
MSAATTTTKSFGKAATTNTLRDTKITLFDESAFKRTDDGLEGPSPYATKRHEGPSFKKTAEPLKSSGKLEKVFEFKEVTPTLVESSQRLNCRKF